MRSGARSASAGSRVPGAVIVLSAGGGMRHVSSASSGARHAFGEGVVGCNRAVDSARSAGVGRRHVGAHALRVSGVSCTVNGASWGMRHVSGASSGARHALRESVVGWNRAVNAGASS
jgi:hypothetical protein